MGPRAGEALQPGLWRDFIAVKGVVFLLRVQLSQPAGNTPDSHKPWHTFPRQPSWPQARGLHLSGLLWPVPCLHLSHQVVTRHRAEVRIQLGLQRPLPTGS